jgi:hypothetical protein
MNIYRASLIFIEALQTAADGQAGGSGSWILMSAHLHIRQQRSLKEESVALVNIHESRHAYSWLVPGIYTRNRLTPVFPSRGCAVSYRLRGGTYTRGRRFWQHRGPCGLGLRTPTIPRGAQVRTERQSDKTSGRRGGRTARGSGFAFLCYPRFRAAPARAGDPRDTAMIRGKPAGSAEAAGNATKRRDRFWGWLPVGSEITHSRFLFWFPRLPRPPPGAIGRAGRPSKSASGESQD